MKPIHDREFGRQTRRAQPRFRIRALHPPAAEVRGTGGSPVRGLGWKSYRRFIASAMA